MRSIGRIGKNRRSFTVVELLIVTTVMAVVALAMYGMLSNGARIWQRMQRRVPAEDIAILFDRMASDIGNSFTFKGIVATGTASSFEFPSLVNSAELGFRSVGKIAYFVDPSNDVVRVEQDYSMVSSERPGSRRVYLKAAEKVSFEYYAYDRQTQEYVWTTDWASRAMPIAVRITIDVREGDERGEYVRTFSVPISM